MFIQSLVHSVDFSCSSAALAAEHQVEFVDVSRHAARLNIASRVHMDSEVFGVLVTRRPHATAGSLSSYEESRLLDVLVHMREELHRAQEGECEFAIWAISSDARDVKARAVWVTLRKTSEGGYGLAMSDI